MNGFSLNDIAVENDVPVLVGFRVSEELLLHLVFQVGRFEHFVEGIFKVDDDASFPDLNKTRIQSIVKLSRFRNTCMC